MKEELCFMSTDFKGDMNKSFSKDNDELTKYYRLPDFTKVHKGYCIVSLTVLFSFVYLFFCFVYQINKRLFLFRLKILLVTVF